MIDECQHAFVEGRWILNAILVANEVVDEMVGKGKDVLLCKLDWKRRMTMLVGNWLIICWTDWDLGGYGGDG